MDTIVEYANKRGLPVFYHCLSWSFLDQPADYNAWIVEAMTRYPSITDWVVVNEDYPDPDIVEKFQLARRTRPDTRLWYNGLFYDEAERIAAIRLVKEGLADAIGVQMHINLYPDMSIYTPLLEWLQANDVPWRITELDVSIPSPTPEFLSLQADVYELAMALCARYECEAVTVWGIADGVSNWLTLSYPLPFDGDYNPKPAWRVLYGGE